MSNGLHVITAIIQTTKEQKVEEQPTWTSKGQGFDNVNIPQQQAHSKIVIINNCCYLSDQAFH